MSPCRLTRPRNTSIYYNYSILVWLCKAKKCRQSSMIRLNYYTILNLQYNLLIFMSSNLVPKVILTETASSLSGGNNGQVVIGVIGTSEKGTINTSTKVSSVSEATTLFGSNTAYGANLVKIISRAFNEWASVVKAISIWYPTLAAGTSGAGATKSVLTAGSAAGATTITVTDGTAYTAADVIYIGTGNTYAQEEKRVVASVVANVITLTQALTFSHVAGETAVVVTAKISSDYTSAIAEMLVDETKNIVICEDDSDATTTAMNTMCNNSASQYTTPCVYMRWPKSTDTESTIVTSASTLNSKRSILVYPLLADFNGAVLSGAETAAVVAGAIASNGIPKLNHNFTTLSSVGGVTTRITDMDALISGWVTPIELKYNTIHLVRFVTTYTKLNWVPDKTWNEAAIRLNVDNIQKTLSQRIQAKFLQSGNTPQIRLAIKTEVIATLNLFAASGILVADEITGTPAYKDPVVTTDPTDNTRVNVDIEICPGKPLNFIWLTFRIFV